MRHDNRGMSLVELILAMTMATIVMGAATLFLRTALNTYTLADAHIDVQKEAQMNLEQVGTWIMEGNRVMAGSITIVSGDVSVTANSVSDNTASEAILVVLNEPYSDKAGDYSAQILAAGSDSDGLSLADCDTDVRVFWLGQTDGKLYMLHLYSETTYSGGTLSVAVKGGEVSGNIAAFDPDPSNFSSPEDEVAYMKLASSYTFANLADYEDEDHVLADYITGFTASLVNSYDSTNNKTGAAVNVSLTYEEEGVKYTMGNQYSIRNVMR